MLRLVSNGAVCSPFTVGEPEVDKGLDTMERCGPPDARYGGEMSSRSGLPTFF